MRSLLAIVRLPVYSLPRSSLYVAAPIAITGKTASNPNDNVVFNNGLTSAYPISGDAVLDCHSQNVSAHIISRRIVYISTFYKSLSVGCRARFYVFHFPCSCFVEDAAHCARHPCDCPAASYLSRFTFSRPYTVLSIREDSLYLLPSFLRSPAVSTAVIMS